MKYSQINPNLFINNRKLLSAKLVENSIAIFNANDIMPTNSDGTMPFKQNSDLFWLSGVDQEESVLAIIKNNNQVEEMLFLKETNEHIAIWEGAKLDKELAQKNSGVEKIYWLNQMDEVLNINIEKANKVYLNKNIHSRSTSEVETRDDRFRKTLTKRHPKKEIVEVAPIMHELRFIKSEIEIELMKHACDITEKGLRRILPIIKPGIMEYQIEAELMHEFLSNRSAGFAYQPIIGSGVDSCVLHYIDNNKMCKDGDVLLMDFGAEYANYASDLTRCIPVNGRFTDRQKEVYNAVLHVKNEAEKLLVPGVMMNDYHKQVGHLMEEQLVNLKLISLDDIKNQNPDWPAYKKYFMHGTSHFIGLDTHDVGLWNTPIEAGMVFTCEPGIYIPEEGLGIRLEDDLVVQQNGAPLNLMSEIPLEVEEIEDAMNSK